MTIDVFVIQFSVNQGQKMKEKFWGNFEQQF